MKQKLEPFLIHTYLAFDMLYSLWIFVDKDRCDKVSC